MYKTSVVSPCKQFSSKNLAVSIKTSNGRYLVVFTVDNSTRALKFENQNSAIELMCRLEKYKMLRSNIINDEESFNEN